MIAETQASEGRAWRSQSTGTHRYPLIEGESKEDRAKRLAKEAHQRLTLARAAVAGIRQGAKQKPEEEDFGRADWLKLRDYFRVRFPERCENSSGARRKRNREKRAA